VGRIPMEHGLPPYVSKHSNTGLYRYFRRPPRGIVGTPFIRSFGTKDKRLVLQKYAAVHAEAEAYMERLISGRRLPDDEIKRMVATRENAKSLSGLPPGELYSRSDWDRFIDQSGSDEMRALAGRAPFLSVRVHRGRERGTHTAAVRKAERTPDPVVQIGRRTGSRSRLRTHHDARVR
jgi:hypothetical protein